MIVRWWLPAAEDLERVCERIERDNPATAHRVATTIYDGFGPYSIVDSVVPCQGAAPDGIADADHRGRSLRG